MRIIERGTGAPLVLIPGIQGRWEYMAPMVDALAQSFRVITFDLCGNGGHGESADAARGFDSFVDQIEQVLDFCGVADAIVCGVSFGGLIALRFAAVRPERTRALLLVSTPGPLFRLRPRHRLYTRVPWLFGPLFLAEMPRRLRAELRVAIPVGRDRRRFSWRQIRTALSAPVSLSAMAARARLIGAYDVRLDCEGVCSPTLVVTGEPALDHVVSADGSSEYARLIRAARFVRLERTGHLGCVTKPDVFAAIVRAFVAGHGRWPDAARADSREAEGDRHDAA